MNYQQKYLKYKEKYINLKNQHGGDLIHITSEGWDKGNYKIDKINNLKRNYIGKMNNGIISVNFSKDKEINPNGEWDFIVEDIKPNNSHSGYKESVKYKGNYKSTDVKSPTDFEIIGNWDKEGKEFYGISKDDDSKNIKLEETPQNLNDIKNNLAYKLIPFFNLLINEDQESHKNILEKRKLEGNDDYDYNDPNSYIYYKNIYIKRYENIKKIFSDNDWAMFKINDDFTDEDIAKYYENKIKFSSKIIYDYYIKSGETYYLDMNDDALKKYIIDNPLNKNTKIDLKNEMKIYYHIFLQNELNINNFSRININKIKKIKKKIINYGDIYNLMDHNIYFIIKKEKEYNNSGHYYNINLVNKINKKEELLKKKIIFIYQDNDDEYNKHIEKDFYSIYHYNDIFKYSFLMNYIINLNYHNKAFLT